MKVTHRMMRDGKLMWHHREGGWWFTSAHDDEYRWYTAQREDGGWVVSIKERFTHKDTELGWFIYLKDAKKAADIHHHKMILESNKENLKEYIKRYPVEDDLRRYERARNG
jgi:hypothetical protein